MTFLLERAPPPIFLLLSSGPCLSALYINEGFVDLEKFVWSVIGQLVSIERKIIGERARHSQGNTIENRECLFVCLFVLYVWTYVCHFVL